MISNSFQHENWCLFFAHLTFIFVETAWFSPRISLSSSLSLKMTRRYDLCYRNFLTRFENNPLKFSHQFCQLKVLHSQNAAWFFLFVWCLITINIQVWMNEDGYLEQIVAAKRHTTSIFSHNSEFDHR